MDLSLSLASARTSPDHELTFSIGASSSSGTGNNNTNFPMLELMFRKVMTPSDVGRLNRLVIPKHHAERYFPLDLTKNRNGALLSFQDRNGKMWIFRYSYWRGSESYVMTKGWRQFVKEKKLDAGDIVSFQRGIGDESERLKLYIVCEHSGGEAFSDESGSESCEYFGGEASSSESDSGSSITTVADTSNTNFDYNAFSDFLIKRGLTLSGCRPTDIIDFLCAQKYLGDSSALVGRLSAAYEGCGIKPKDNPFRSLAVIRYLQMVRGIYGKTECILVISCDDNLDVVETSFIKAILTELHEREVTSFTYNLSRRENMDVEMLYKCSVGILVLSNSFARSSQSLDHLVTIMEHWKAKDLVVIPVYFIVTISDILDGQFKPVPLQYLNYFLADRVPKWKAAIAELASIDGHQWTFRTQFILAKEVVRNACLRLYLKNSNNLVRILALLDHPQPSDAEIEGIWGMAGIGKTSIAKEIFEILAPQYDFCYFLQDFHLICQSKGLRQIRDDFFSKIFGEEKLSIGACETKLSFMRDWFHNKAILIVLDDVNDARAAEYVVGGFGWFSHGHRIS